MALIFAGFNGVPVVGGTGIKAPVVFDEETSRFGLVRKNSLNLDWTDAEIAAQEAHSLLSRVSTHVAYQEGFIAFYAHTQFISPQPATDGLSSRLEIPNDLQLYPKLDSYIAFASPARAASILQKWSADLLRSARLALEDNLLSFKERGQAAFAEAMRARFATPMSSGRRSDRAEALALACVSLVYQGVASDAVIADAELDELSGEVAIRTSSLLAELDALPARAKKARRDISTSPYRRFEDAA
jgi:hypothetical protein